MAQRLITIIDADVNLATHLQSELARYGLTVEVATDSNDLMSRKDGFPELVVLCIDPKRTGWAVCNRLRKSPLLKSIPLIITSAEATEKDFDDHKKLKTRAEDYLHKPFSVEALVEKLAALIIMPQPEAATAEIDIETEIGEIEVEAEELSAGDAYAHEETLGGVDANRLPATHEGADDESTRIGFSAEIDGEVDLETNAAFAAIGLDDPVDAGGAAGQALSPFDDDFGLPESPSVVPQVIEAVPAPVAVQAAPVAVQAAPVAVQAAPAAVARSMPADPAPADLDSSPVPRLAAEELDLQLDDVRDPEPVAPVPAPVSSAAKPAMASGEVDALRADVERLRRENEELRSRPKVDPAAATSFSREREFLNLRETINKKEKEVLDLRDTVDSKERLMLDNKDKLRDAERRLREVEERSLATERELVASREKVEALSDDKERAVEREKQLKGRLEDAQKSIQRGEQEVEQWRGKHGADTAALDEKLSQAVARQREELGALRQTHAEAEAQLKSEHAGALAQAQQAQQAALAALKTEHEQAIGLQDAQAKQTLENELKAAERRQGEAIVELESRHERALAQVETQRQEALRVAAEESRRTLEQMAADQGEERQRIEADHARAILAMDQRKGEELAALAAELATQQAAALAQRGVEHEGELKSAREQAARKLQALEEAHEDLKAGMQARHATQVKDLREQHVATVAEYDAAIAERDGIITQQRDQIAQLDAALVAEQTQGQERTRKLGELEATLEQQQAQLASREATLEERARRIGELEQESARYQDQVLRAYQRIKSDENIVQRAKKALAIALTLLEENEPEAGEDAKA